MTRAELVRFMREESRKWAQRELEEEDEPMARQMRAYSHVWDLAAGMVERMDDHPPRSYGREMTPIGVTGYDRHAEDLERFAEEEDE